MKFLGLRGKEGLVRSAVVQRSAGEEPPCYDELLRALRSHGDPGWHGRSAPTATPASCETLIHGLSDFTRHGAMPVPLFEMRISAGVEDCPLQCPILAPIKVKLSMLWQ